MNESTFFALFDAAALRDEERQTLRSTPEAVWGYDDLRDEQAVDMGPVWAPLDSVTTALVHSLWRDADRAWAATCGEAPVAFAGLSRHMRQLRYVHTHDGQRYFFRFADARSLAAMAVALAPDQRPRLMGPITLWRYRDRDGAEVALKSATTGPAHSPHVRLQPDELGALLEATWPDQLLAGAMEADAALATNSTPQQRYEWAQQLCAALAAQRIENYPVQREAMACTLHTKGATLQDPAFADALAQAQRQKSPALLAARYASM